MALSILGEFLKNGNFKLAGQDCMTYLYMMYRFYNICFSVVNQIIDELLEEIRDQIKNAGLDPLPIPDITLPFSMDKVIFATTTFGI